MDNNNSEQKTAPKKKVSKKVLRQRRLSALAIVALIVLIFFIIIAKSCSNEPTGDDESSTTNNSITTSATTTTISTTTTVTTTVTTTNPLSAKVQLSTRELFINVGERNVSIIQVYPDNSTEANEVWKSMDESIATVDQYGYVTGVSKGETFIVLSFDNNPGVEIEIKVSVADNAVVTPNNATIDSTTTDSGNSAPVIDTPTTPVYGYTGSIDDENVF